MQRKITFDGEEARLLRKYFDHLAFHASDSDLPDQDERGAVGLTSAGKEVGHE
jgi:hypothetical protein